MPPKSSPSDSNSLPFRAPFLLIVLFSSSIFGLLYVQPNKNTIIMASIFYLVGILAESIGYHRLWAHRSYNASALLRIVLAIAGCVNMNGSIKEWSKIHRYHHRHADSPKDPFNRKKGFLFSFIGHNFQDYSKLDLSHMEDLDNDWVVNLQDFLYPILSVATGWLLPAAIAYIWEDPMGGLYYGGMIRTFLKQMIGQFLWALNRTVGHKPYNDMATAANNTLISIVTFGEGYLNYHYEFPSDYRIGCFYYHFDPVKWIIRVFSFIGLASGLKKTQYSEILRLRIEKKQEKLDQLKKSINYGPDPSTLPVWSMETIEKKISQGFDLIIMDNIVHDITKFMNEHPGGDEILRPKIGKDATVAFNGGVQRHSKAARNLAALMRVAVLEPKEKLKQAQAEKSSETKEEIKTENKKKK